MNFNLKLFATEEILVLICSIISKIDTGKKVYKNLTLGKLKTRISNFPCIFNGTGDIALAKHVFLSFF